MFIFDQPWQMLQALFQPVAALLGKSPDDIHMSLSVTCPQKNEEAPKFYAKNCRNVSRIKNIFSGKAGGCSCSFSAVRFLLGLFKLVSLGRSAATLDKPTGTRATKTHITMAVSGC